MVATLCCAMFPRYQTRRPLLSSQGHVSAGQVLNDASRIQCEKFLRLRDPTQGIAANRYELTAHPLNIGEGLRDQNRLVDGATHGGDAACFIDRRADHSEIEPIGASDISV